MKNIAVIGAGTMGNGIAHTFAQFDYNVQLIDVTPLLWGIAILLLVEFLFLMKSLLRLAKIRPKPICFH